MGDAVFVLDHGIAIRRRIGLVEALGFGDDSAQHITALWAWKADFRSNQYQK
jgi:hypothetical protein